MLDVYEIFLNSKFVLVSFINRQYAMVAAGCVFVISCSRLLCYSTDTSQAHVDTTMTHSSSSMQRHPCWSVLYFV